jgi:hypothetical protein
MRNGSFTGKKLSDYISGGNADYQTVRSVSGIQRRTSGPMPIFESGE